MEWYNKLGELVWEVYRMRLLRVSADHFKNAKDGLTIDLVPQARKSDEDKQYEMNEIDSGLFVYSTGAFIGKNASGKTTALDLLDCAYSILGEYRLEGKHYSCEGTRLELFFYDKGYIYRYRTILDTRMNAMNRTQFGQQELVRKKYYSSYAAKIYDSEGFEAVDITGKLPKDTSIVFFVSDEQQTLAVYFSSSDNGADVYSHAFNILEAENLGIGILSKILFIFDENITELSRLDDHNFRIVYCGQESIKSDKELLYWLSSGTTKGMLLYMMMAASLTEGFDLLVDEIENHFHKTLVRNMIDLYRDKTVNRKGASLFFTTHYCEILDSFNRQDNIWITRSEGKVTAVSMREDHPIRRELLKSIQFYNNTFRTDINYDALMALKKELMA